MPGLPFQHLLLIVQTILIVILFALIIFGLYYLFIAIIDQQLLLRFIIVNDIVDFLWHLRPQLAKYGAQLVQTY